MKPSAILNDTVITDNQIPIEKKIPHFEDFSSPDLTLINNPSTCGKYEDSENENLQLHTNHEAYPRVLRQTLKTSCFDPSFFKHTTKFIEFSSATDIPLIKETILEYQRRVSVPKLLSK